MKEIKKKICFERSFFFYKFPLNTATQSREALKEQTNICRQGLLLCNLTFQIQKEEGSDSVQLEVNYCRTAS